MNYENKSITTKTYLTELISKSWQEIEYLQSQKNNLENSIINDKVQKFFNNLLTSYYVFVGGIEMLLGELDVDTEYNKSSAPEEMILTTSSFNETPDEPTVNQMTQVILEENNSIEPFEYFVDFDEPIGEPISDKDLYGN